MSEVRHRFEAIEARLAMAEGRIGQLELLLIRIPAVSEYLLSSIRPNADAPAPLVALAGFDASSAPAASAVERRLSSANKLPRLRRPRSRTRKRRSAQ